MDPMSTTVMPEVMLLLLRAIIREVSWVTSPMELLPLINAILPGCHQAAAIPEDFLVLEPQAIASGTLKPAGRLTAAAA